MQIKIADKVLKYLKKLEIECEKNICTLNYDVYKMYKYALDNNKDIYIISDFYLEKKEVIDDLVKHNVLIMDKDRIRVATDYIYVLDSIVVKLI